MDSYDRLNGRICDIERQQLVIIKSIIAQGCEVIPAAEADQLRILQDEFMELDKQLCAIFEPMLAAAKINVRTRDGSDVHG